MNADSIARPDRFTGEPGEMVVVAGPNKGKVLGADPGTPPTPSQQALIEGRDFVAEEL